MDRSEYVRLISLRMDQFARVGMLCDMYQELCFAQEERHCLIRYEYAGCSIGIHLYVTELREVVAVLEDIISRLETLHIRMGWLQNEIARLKAESGLTRLF